LSALAAVAGCSKSPVDQLDGAWELDMPATLDQARSIGAGSQTSKASGARSMAPA
jgi:hypothetical protein